MTLHDLHKAELEQAKIKAAIFINEVVDLRWFSNGEEIKVSDMHTDHLFNAFRMIWNDSVPDDAKIEPFKKYHPRTWSKRFVRAACLAIYNELEKRTLKLWQQQELQRMKFMVQMRWSRQYDLLEESLKHYTPNAENRNQNA